MKAIVIERFVLDASVAASWLFDDETAPGSDLVLTRFRRGEALVPALWHIELRNALLVGIRRGRLPPSAPSDRLDALSDLPVLTDADPDLDTAFVLAEKHRLTFYDAIYLELAKRREAPLATLDKALARAAVDEELELVVDSRAA